MSLINENDLIIPGTVGIITSAVKEANRYLDEIKEHTSNKEVQNKNISNYIGSMIEIQYILQNRIKGIPLEKIVDASRISNDKSRKKIREKEIMNHEIEKTRVYEDWFTDSE